MERGFFPVFLLYNLVRLTVRCISESKKYSNDNKQLAAVLTEHLPHARPSHRGGAAVSPGDLTGGGTPRSAAGWGTGSAHQGREQRPPQPRRPLQCVLMATALTAPLCPPTLPVLRLRLAWPVLSPVRSLLQVDSSWLVGLFLPPSRHSTPEGRGLSPPTGALHSGGAGDHYPSTQLCP